MSLSLKPVPVVRVVNNVTEINKQKVFGINVGGSKNLYRPYNSTSGDNNSNVIWSIRPPNNTIINRHGKVQVDVSLDFTFSSVVAGSVPLQSGFDAFRRFPLTKVINTFSSSQNGNSVDIAPYDFIEALSQYWEEDEFIHGSLTTVPCMADASQNYSDLNPGTHRNPLNSFWDSNSNSPMPRGAFPYTSVTNEVDSLTANVQATLAAPIFLSPWLFGSDYHSAGFFNLETLEVVINLISNLSRMWSHDNSSGNILESIVVTFTNWQLLLNQIEIQPTTFRPPLVPYNYYDYVRHISDIQPVILPGESGNLTSQDLTFGSIPDCVYCFAKRRNQDETFLTTDTFLRINSVTILFNNSNTILSTATARQLYAIAHKNGLKKSWNEYSGELMFTMSGSENFSYSGCGGVLKLNFSDEIFCNVLQAPGLREKVQFSLIMNVTNISNSSLPMSLYVIERRTGIYSITSAKTAYAEIGVISEQDILKVRNSRKSISLKSLDNLGQLQGGKFNVKSFLKDAGDVAKALVPIVQSGVAISKALGAGGAMVGGQGGILVGGKKRGRPKGSKNKKKKKRGRPKKKALTMGGKMMNREELYEAYSNY